MLSQIIRLRLSSSNTYVLITKGRGKETRTHTLFPYMQGTKAMYWHGKKVATCNSGSEASPECNLPDHRPSLWTSSIWNCQRISFSCLSSSDVLIWQSKQMQIVTNFLFTINSWLSNFLARSTIHVAYSSKQAFFSPINEPFKLVHSRSRFSSFSLSSISEIVL